MMTDKDIRLVDTLFEELSAEIRRSEEVEFDSILSDYIDFFKEDIEICKNHDSSETFLGYIEILIKNIDRKIKYFDTLLPIECYPDKLNNREKVKNSIEKLRPYLVRLISPDNIEVKAVATSNLFAAFYIVFRTNGFDIQVPVKGRYGKVNEKKEFSKLFIAYLESFTVDFSNYKFRCDAYDQEAIRSELKKISMNSKIIFPANKKLSTLTKYLTNQFGYQEVSDFSTKNYEIDTILEPTSIKISDYQSFFLKNMIL